MKEQPSQEKGLVRQAFIYAVVTSLLCAGVLYFTPLNADEPVQNNDVQEAPEMTQNGTAMLPATPQQEEVSADSTAINKIPLEFYDQAFSSSDIVDDKLNYLPPDFKVPEGIKKRVAFWLDIYTKYSSHFSIIHDSREPWIVYKVVDLRPIYESEKNRFIKDMNDHAAIRKARLQVKSTLLRLAKKKKFNALTSDEYSIYRLLESRKGPRKKVFLEAAKNIRVQRGQKNFFKSGLISSSRYLNEMEDIFARYDLPVELVRLPLVESSFNLEATSKVGASGVWQFMTGTGKKYLKVGRYFDERNSPIKATEAAAKLMLSNFKLTHSWPLAITAYNHGVGGVKKACKRLQTTSIADLVNKYNSRSFSFASQNFYSEYLAALYGEKYQDKIFGSMTKIEPLDAEEAYLKHRMKAKVLVDLVGMTVEELKLYNPDLKAQAIGGYTSIPAGYHVRLPPGRKSRLELFNQEDDLNSLAKNTRRKSSKI